MAGFWDESHGQNACKTSENPFQMVGTDYFRIFAAEKIFQIPADKYKS
jgi:hypothetical protein